MTGVRHGSTFVLVLTRKEAELLLSGIEILSPDSAGVTTTAEVLATKLAALVLDGAEVVS